MNEIDRHVIRRSVRGMLLFFSAVSLITAGWYTYQESIDTPSQWLSKLLGHALILLVMMIPLLLMYRRLMKLLAEEQIHFDELALLSRIVEQSPVSIVTTDKQGAINYVNDCFCRLTGYTRQEALGQNPRILKTDLTPPERFAEMWHNLSRGQEWRGELCNRKKDGSLYWEMAYLFPVYNSLGELVHYAGIKENITERKEVQDALVRAKKEAEDANRSKSLFLATMSHEIRTPMNAILGMSYLALQSGLSPQQQGYVEKVIVAARSLLGIINDILDFSKIEAGKMELEQVPLDLAELLEGVKSIVEVAAAEKGIVIYCSCSDTVPPFVVGDPLRLRQVLINLGGNGVKFTEQGTVGIRVTLSPHQPTEHGLAAVDFTVSDSGIGMDQGELQRIFTPFEQADSSITRRYGGTGLGLSIVKTLVEMMGGELAVSSSKGEGSRFTFTLSLPVCSERQPENDRTPVSRAALQVCAGRTALLVEDNQVNRMIAREMLTRLGMSVTTVDNGQQAVDQLSRGELFDLVLMDLQMPLMDGYQATSLIRKIHAADQLPVIALTGFVTREEQQRVLAAGMNDLLDKPIEPEQLHAMLVKWLKPVAHGAVAAVNPVVKTPRDPSQLPMLPGFDLDAACRRLGGDRELLLEIIADAAIPLTSSLKELTGVFNTLPVEREKLLFLLHSLAGSCANIGAIGLHTVLRKLETAVKDDTPPDQLQLLLLELESSTAEFFSLLAMLNAPQQAAAGDRKLSDCNRATLAPLLEQLRQELAGHRGSALTTYRTVQQYLPGSVERDRLEKAVKKFDFSDATALLLLLAKKLNIVLGV